MHGRYVIRDFRKNDVLKKNMKRNILEKKYYKRNSFDLTNISYNKEL